MSKSFSKVDIKKLQQAYIKRLMQKRKNQNKWTNGIGADIKITKEMK